MQCITSLLFLNYFGCTTKRVALLTWLKLVTEVHSIFSCPSLTILSVEDTKLHYTLALWWNSQNFPKDDDCTNTSWGFSQIQFQRAKHPRGKWDALLPLHIIKHIASQRVKLRFNRYSLMESLIELSFIGGWWFSKHIFFTNINLYPIYKLDLVRLLIIVLSSWRYTLGMHTVWILLSPVYLRNAETSCSVGVPLARHQIGGAQAPPKARQTKLLANMGSWLHKAPRCLPSEAQVDRTPTYQNMLSWSFIYLGKTFM